MFAVGVIYALMSSAQAASPGGFRTPGDGAASLGTLRVAAVINPEDEQILGAVLEGQARVGSASLGLSTGFTVAALAGEGVVDQGLGLTRLSLLFPISGGETWSLSLGGALGVTPIGSNAFATVASEVEPGGQLTSVVQFSRRADRSLIACRASGGVQWAGGDERWEAQRDFVYPLYHEVDGFAAGRAYGPVWAGGEIELIPTDMVPLSLRPLLRVEPLPGAAFDLGLQLPVQWRLREDRRASTIEIFQVLARVTLWDG